MFGIAKTGTENKKIFYGTLYTKIERDMGFVDKIIFDEEDEWNPGKKNLPQDDIELVHCY